LDFEPISGGTQEWQNPNGVNCKNGENASALIGRGESSHYLQLYRWNLDIPALSRIDSIHVTITKSTTGIDTIDKLVALAKSVTSFDLIQTNVSSAPWTEAISQTTYPLEGNDPLWGASWLPSQLNNDGFGFSLQITKEQGSTSLGDVASVYCISLSIGYTRCPKDCNYPNGNCNFNNLTCSCKTGYDGDLCEIAPPSSGIDSSSGVYPSSDYSSSGGEETPTTKSSDDSIGVGGIIGFTILGVIVAILVASMLVFLFKKVRKTSVLVLEQI